MQRSSWIVLVGAVVIGYLAYTYQADHPAPTPCPCPAKPSPKEPAKPKKPSSRPRGPCGPGPCPSMELNATSLVAKKKSAGQPVLGGVDSPDGTVHILFLPPEIDWPKNIPSRGLGCCGFRSFDYCGRIQNVPEVVNLPEKMRDAGIAGGDYPQKHSQIVAKLCPGIAWWQDTTKSLELLAACCKSQRPCCVDYSGHDPHYAGGIAHCVTLVACDLEADWIAILDNNYPSLDEIVWMHVSAFTERWGGWSYGLLAETPGRYNAAAGNLRQDYWIDRASGPIFGGAEGPFSAGESTIDGASCTIQDIIDRFGGQFVPIKPAIPVNVDHRIDLENLQQPLLAAVAAGFVLWVITDRRSIK